MASNYNRKSASSGSRRQPARGRGASGSGRAARPGGSAARPQPRSSSKGSAYRAIPGGQLPNRRSGQAQRPLPSGRVGDLDRADRAARAQRTHRRHLVRLGIAAACAVALVAGGVVLYNSDAFAIESVSVRGVEHLTAAEMEQLAGVPTGTTLLRVDAGAIESRLLMDAWVQDVSVNRVFPSTLEIVVTERTIAAVVNVATDNASSSQDWAIASDGMWLMPIPDQDSEAGRNTSPKVYEDAAAVLHIADVPYGVEPKVGAYCGDSNVNNALSIVDGMTTDLADRVTTVKATETESTTLVLDTGIEIVFGSAEDIRDKERVCLEIMEQHPDVVYINVRVVESPTWRAP